MRVIKEARAWGASAGKLPPTALPVVVVSALITVPLLPDRIAVPVREVH